MVVSENDLAKGITMDGIMDADLEVLAAIKNAGTWVTVHRIAFDMGRRVLTDGVQAGFGRLLQAGYIEPNVEVPFKFKVTEAGVLVLEARS